MIMLCGDDVGGLRLSIVQLIGIALVGGKIFEEYISGRNGNGHLVQYFGHMSTDNGVNRRAWFTPSLSNVVSLCTFSLGVPGRRPV